MSKEDDVIKALISGGLIGAGLGALLTGSRKGSALGAIAGAALMATLKANKEAESVDFPIYIVENDSLYEKRPDGTMVFVRSIGRKSGQYRSNYTLK